MERLLGAAECPQLRILDVGTGGCDVLAWLQRWFGERDLNLDGVGIDSGRLASVIARRNLSREGATGLSVVRGDARALPFPDRAFDVSISSTFLHHLDAAGAVEALREMARVSRRGIIVTDLRRGPAGYLAAWSLSRTIWRMHPYTRHDATVSARAAFTIGEVRDLAADAGLQAVFEPQPWFRWALRWRRPS